MGSLSDRPKEASPFFGTLFVVSGSDQAVHCDEKSRVGESPLLVSFLTSLARSTDSLAERTSGRNASASV